MTARRPDPPAHLSERAQALWTAVLRGRRVSPGRLALVQAALEALDRADGARELIAQQGIVVTSERSGVAHAHPAVKIEREARAQFASMWRALGFNYDSDLDE